MRRRTAFEQDLRELVLKVLLGCALGIGLRVWAEWDGWLAPLIIGNIAVFFLASIIRGEGRFSD